MSERTIKVLEETINKVRWTEAASSTNIETLVRKIATRTDKTEIEET